MSAPVLNLATIANQQILTITPPAAGVSFQGTIQVPGDKSISHRALMLGSLATGETIIEGLLLGEDPCSTANCFRALGVEISELNTEKVIVKGIGLANLQEAADVLDAGNSGTTIRLMLGILAGLDGRFFTITGDQSLRSRPMSRVIKPLSQMGAQIWGRQGNTRAPLAVQGQKLNPITYHSPVASAQVKSCVLLAGLGIEGDTRVIEPALSRDHSERMLKAFGAKIITNPADCSVTVTGGGELIGQRVVVPGDISSAAFWLVAAAITPGSDLVIEKVGVNPTRTGILEVLGEMGADITILKEEEIAGEPVADLRVRSSSLKGCTIDGAIIPRLIDEIPIIAVAASLAQGKTVIKDAAELRVKESDRLAVMASQLQRLGVTITELPDGLVIEGGSRFCGSELNSFGDHRIAMSLAIAALNSNQTSIIQGAEAAAISYPNFLPTLAGVIHSHE